jgi:hypothetical protein
MPKAPFREMKSPLETTGHESSLVILHGKYTRALTLTFENLESV